MPLAGSPTAEGDLDQTPFAHLVVYALERKLTGTLLLEESPERIHTMTFVRGSPAKLKPADEFLRLGRLLTDEGVIDDATLQGALSTRGLLGDVLVMSGHVDPEVLERTLERQFRMRFVRCFTFDPKTKYRYYEGADELEEWGAEPNRIDAYELLWAGLERYGDRASSMAPSLAALTADQPLTVHARAPLERFGLEGLASDVVELLLLEPTSFTELCALEVAPVELTRKVVFALLLLRCLDLGKGALPVGVTDRAPQTLARVQLKQSVQRLVAAAPDESGDGAERVRRRDRRRDDGEDSGEPSSAASTPRDPPSSDRSKPLSLPAAPRLPEDGPKSAATPAAEGAPASAAPVTAKSAGPDPSSKAPPPRKLTPPPTKPKLEPPPPPRATKAAAADDPPEGDSSVRAIRSVIENTPVPQLLAMARARIDAKDGSAAFELAQAALDKGGASVIARLLVATAKSLKPHADLKALRIELDEIVAAEDGHAEARFFRGCLRRRLGDDAGARRDFEKALELDPSHEGAKKELDATPTSGETATDPKRGGLLGRLFRR
jgi:hypothetical protein